MNEPKNLKRFEQQLELAKNGDKEAEKFIRDLIGSIMSFPDTPTGAIIAAGRAVLEFNREEWREWQKENQ